MNAKPAGYSGTPLAKKLGIVQGTRVFVKNPPSDYAQWLAPVPPDVTFEDHVSLNTDVVHAFYDRKAVLKRDLEHFRAVLRGNGSLWISWPKKLSKVPTDITEDTIRELALPLGFVDVKVCAVSEIWSGLKLVVRKELR